MESEEGTPVQLYVYDLSHGLASVLSPAIIGQQIEGVWHTAVVVYGREYFYGAGGITSCAPGSTQLGEPLRVLKLGETFVPFSVFLDYVQGLATTTYTGDKYHLLEHNCNHFSEEVAAFLCGGHVPKDILELPERALPPPLRAALQALLDGMLPSAPTQPVYSADVRHSRRRSPDYDTLNTQVEEARAAAVQLAERRAALADKMARRQRRRDRKAHKKAHQGQSDADADADDDTVMAEAVEQAAGPSRSAAGEPRESPDRRRLDEEKRRADDPPIVFRDIDAATELDALRKALEGAGGMSEPETISLEELRQYLIEGEGSWVLGDEFFALVGRVLRGSCGREPLLRCLAAAALRDDVSLILHQDRREHALVNYAYNVDRLPLPEQRALALFMCNLFENISSSEWLLYISEWEHEGQALSNIRATTKVAVHALLSEDEELRDVGSALMYNVAAKEVKTVVFDEVCAELVLALAQFVSGGACAGGAGSDELAWRGARALTRLAAHSRDAPQLLRMLGLDPSALKGTSPRVDEQIDLLISQLQ